MPASHPPKHTHSSLNGYRAMVTVEVPWGHEVSSSLALLAYSSQDDKSIRTPFPHPRVMSSLKSDPKAQHLPILTPVRAEPSRALMFPASATKSFPLLSGRHLFAIHALLTMKRVLQFLWLPTKHQGPYQCYLLLI